MGLDPLELTGGLAIGEGLGGAIADTVTPRLQSFKNGQWAAHTDVPLDAAQAAAVAAENFATFGDMVTEASFTGFDSERFQHIYDVTLSAPGMGELLAMARRGTINPGNFTHGLRKAKFEPMWDDALTELQTVRLTPQELALGIVRSTVEDPGLLVVTLDTAGSTIPKYPHWPGNALKEAAAGGIDGDRLRAMVGAVGLPMSPQQAASATFRGIINRAAFNLSILEGDIRPEYAEAIFEQARQIPTVGEMMEHALRGFESVASAKNNAQRHGSSDADAQLVYDNLGRAPAVHAITTGLARGGTYDGSPKSVPEPYLTALRRANIRPEWFDIEYANRFSYPSAFVLRALAQAGDLGNEAAIDAILADIGWPPGLRAKVAAAWSVAAGTSTDPHVKKAETTLFTEAHKAYVKTGLTQQQVTPALNALAVPAAAQAQVFKFWDAEKVLASETAP